jgi:hypothetical protein
MVSSSHYGGPSLTWTATSPLLHSRAKLIEACEAIEQSKTSMEKPQKEEGTSIQKKAKRAASKISAPPAKKQNSGSMYHCTEHGHNFYTQ